MYRVALFLGFTLSIAPIDNAVAQDVVAAISVEDLQKHINEGRCADIKTAVDRKTCWTLSSTFDCSALQDASEQNNCLICKLSISFCTKGFVIPDGIVAKQQPDIDIFKNFLPNTLAPFPHQGGQVQG